MRDLRFNVRDYTEPIQVNTLEKVFVDGEAITQVIGDPVLLYGNVMINKDRISNGANGSSLIGDGIKVNLLNPGTDLKIIPELTTFVIRGDQYIVTKLDQFNVNAETIIVYASIKNG